MAEVCTVGENEVVTYQLDIPDHAQCMEPRVFMFKNCGAHGRVHIWFRITSVILGILKCISYYWTIARVSTGSKSIRFRFIIRNDLANVFVEIHGFNLFSAGLSFAYKRRVTYLCSHRT